MRGTKVPAHGSDDNRYCVSQAKESRRLEEVEAGRLDLTPPHVLGASIPRSEVEGSGERMVPVRCQDGIDKHSFLRRSIRPRSAILELLNLDVFFRRL